MAQSKALTVKVSVAKVIKALETKLAQVTKEFASQEANEAKFMKAHEKWKAEVFAFALANAKKSFNLRTNYRSYNNTLNIDFDLTVNEKEMPAEPGRDFEVIQEWKYKEIKEEIENALRVLRMTDEEIVSTSTMNSISQYL